MKKTVCAVLAFVIIMCSTIGVSAAEHVYSASVEGIISLHISPSEDSFKITDVPACSKMRIIKKERTWGLVEFQNKCGWINLSFTRDTYDKAAEATGNDFLENVCVSSQGEKAVLYNVPSLSEALGSEEKYTVPNDMIIQIKRVTTLGWGLASMNGKYAWIQMKHTKEYETQTEKSTAPYEIYYVYVLSDKGKGAELREKPGSGSLYAVIPDCIKLTVREEKGNYGYVSYDGINGWIDLRFTAQSLSNAQANAGTEVNAEYEITPPNDAQEAELLSVPSEKSADGGFLVGSIKRGEAVFVLRSTLSGWSLVNHVGNLGWIAPGMLTLSESSGENMTEVFDTAKTAYVSTPYSKGMKLYAFCENENPIATVPECVKVSIIAEKDGYEYIYCDYASGWAQKEQTVQSEKEALESNTLKKKEYFSIKKETSLMSLPTYSSLCTSEELQIMGKGEFFEVSKIVSTGKHKWGFTEINGKKGWINLNCAKEATSPLVIIFQIVSVCAAVIILTVLLYIIIRKRKDREG